MAAAIAEQSGTTECLCPGEPVRKAPAARRRGPSRYARAAQPPRAQLRLVAADERVIRHAPGELVRTNHAATLRLTRRGRLVVTATAVLLAAALSVVLAGAAQALGHSAGPARPGPAAVTKVEVQPGQSLWTLAEAYDPNADTRQVIQEILQLNSMSSDQVQPGQLLWMPRD